MLQNTFKQYLPCQLTEQERLLKSEELVKRLEEKDGLEDRKKSSADDFKSLITAKECEARRLRREVSTGIEHREVECQEVFRFARNLVETVRLDTGEVVSSRAMRPEERQAAMDFGDEAGDAEDLKSRTH